MEGRKKKGPMLGKSIEPLVTNWPQIKGKANT